MSLKDKFKCGYCKWIVWCDENGQISHDCFTNCEAIVMDANRNIFRKDSVGTLLHFDETAGENSTDLNNIQESVCDKENEIPEEIAQKEQLDEDLISVVKERPALYDFRLPVKERGRKQKDYLWQEVSECLKGLYTAAEAEKRWNYLKDCYRKARNIYKKQQSIVQKSGAAGVPKNCEVKPSFRHYDVMTFLNDILEYRQTVTSLKKSICEMQGSSLNTVSIPSTSTNNNDNFVDVLTPVTNDNNSTLSSPISSTSPKPKKRKRIDFDEYEEALINSLTQTTERNPIDGFVSRLAEGLQRLSYKTRSKLEIEFLSKLYEVENDEKRNN